MSAKMDRIQAAFPQDITNRIVQAVNIHPQQSELLSLFGDIAGLVSGQQTTNGAVSSKKRKLDDEAPAATQHANGTSSSSAAISNASIAFECKDVSFQVPARKKLRLQLVHDAHDRRRQEIRLQNQQSNEVEHTLPAEQIDQAFCLPVPDKQQRQWNFVLFPKPGAMTAECMSCEQMVFTMNETAPTGARSAEHAITEKDTFITLTELELNRLLQSQGKHVIIPNAEEFASSIPQSHRKGEKAYHVKAFRGSKDGYLFFLPNGIVFGFKKPLAFFPFSSIESISYTSVLQRTFNLVIASRESEQADVKEVEFSMLDQADFAGIDDYIKRHELSDASMAAERRAKAYNVNKEKKAAEANSGAEGATDVEDGESELQKAEQQLQDEEDEEEEDYEASGGESDGEGEYSDDDDDGEEYGDAGDEEGDEEVEHEEDAHDE